VGNNSLHGTAIVMETATGKIKAIANLGKQPDGTYIEDLNYGIGKITEPGSIFKLATLMSLLEDKYVDNNSIVDCNGGVQYFSGLRIKDSHLGAGKITVRDAFATSSNVAFASLATQYYQSDPQRFLNHLHKMKLDTLTGVDIVASSGYPLIKKATARSWSNTTIPFMAHGYEELVTPLNMLMLYNAVANNGRMMRPYLVNEIMDYGVTLKKIKPQVIDPQICSMETIIQLKECLKAVVDSVHGTGHRILFDSAYSISGKTGTAVTALDNKGYNKSNKIYQASFIGYFPSETPMFTMAVVIQNSRESKLIYGADVSGTVFKEISDKLYARYLTAPSYSTTVVRDTLINNATGLKNDMRAILNFMHIPFADSAVSGSWRNVMLAQNTAVLNSTANYSRGNLLPDVIGMGLKDAVYLLENKGLRIAIQGKGKIISQQPAAETNFIKGEKITLFLN
ncbi:MAG: penicillin-binding transpeptidase domain-containing protein, partial [Ferruginibacter sp.]